MGSHTSILGYFLQAGFVVKFVLLILLAASLVSWTLIIQRALYFRNKKNEYAAFRKRFWGSSDLSKLHSEMDEDEEEQDGLAAVFYTGLRSYQGISSHY